MSPLFVRTTKLTYGFTCCYEKMLRTVIMKRNSPSYNLNNTFKIRSGWNREVDGQTIHLTENLISMNLLQMSCMITWAQKKFSLQLQKKEWGHFLFIFSKLGFLP